MSAPDVRALPESALVYAAQSGNRAAFTELVRRREAWLRQLLMRLCGDSAESDDLAQEAFVRAWRQVRTLREAHAFGAWLRRLAIRCFLDARRANRLAVEDPSDELLATDPGPAAAAGARIDLERALATLSSPERLCIVLNLAEGLSHADIEDISGLPLGTVKSHIRRGTAKLRRAMGDVDG